MSIRKHIEMKDALEELKNALTQLEKQTLPINTRTVLHNTKIRLRELDKSLNNKVEESRLAALFRVSQSLGMSLYLDDVLIQVMDAVIELTGAERGFLTLIDSTSGDLSLRAARNFEGETLEHKDMEVSRTVIASVVEGGEGVVSTDAQTDPRFAGQDSIVFFNLRSILCAPLRARGQVIGVIYVDNRAQSGLFTAEDLELLNAFASQAAVAIENARLYTRTDQDLAARVGELETLSHIDEELNAQLDLPLVVEITRDWALKGTDAVESWIALRSGEDEGLDFIAGPVDGELPAPSSEVVSLAIKDSNPQTIQPHATSPLYMVIPLIHSGVTTGALIVASQETFSKTDGEFLYRLAGRATAAIENARLFSAVQGANAAKSQFVSIVTHELRIPLTSIKGYSDLIRQGTVGAVNEQQTSFLNVIHNNVDRMAALISDLSDISRIERGKIKLELTSIPLQTTVDETLSGLQPAIEEKSQILEVDIPQDLPEIYVDPNRLVQVLTNLVNNASKYSPALGSISIHAYPVDSTVRIEISDTGIGINPNDRSSIFSQFFRSEDPAVREVNGWGLGLNVSKRLVEIMGGQIGYESEYGDGSTFWFTVPQA
jgi:signal transduction histidine kinase